MGGNKKCFDGADWIEEMEIGSRKIKQNKKRKQVFVNFFG